MILDSNEDRPALTISDVPNEQGSGPMNVLTTGYSSKFSVSILWKVKLMTSFNAVKNLPISETNTVIDKLKLEQILHHLITRLLVAYRE